MFYQQIEKIYKSSLYNRQDDDGSIFYFSAEDFPGLLKKPFAFTSSDGHMLQGYFYYYENPQAGRLIIFDHGMGAGHRAYMKEIEILAKHGYLVFAYDHTGCTESGGKTTGGFVQSLKDLNDAINALQADDEYKQLDISVVGHSWGAFSTLNICALHPEVKHQVAISGFISVEKMLRQFFSGILSPFFKKIYAAECAANPDFIKYNAISSLKESKSKVLVMHSEDDKTCKCSAHFDIMQKELAGKENIRFVKLQGKRHNPNYTAEAVIYKDQFFAEYQAAQKKKLLQTKEQKQAFLGRWDWNKMTEQDCSIWEMIFQTLDA